MINKLNFAHKIIAVAALLLLLALTASTTSHYVSLKNQTEMNLTRAIEEIGNSVSGNIANWLNSKLQIISALAENTTAKHSSDNIFNFVRLADGAGQFKNAYVGVEETGEFILDDKTIELPADFDARQRPWYTQVKQDRKIALTEPYIDVTINELLISAVAPVIDNGSFIGAAGGDILLGDITEIINKIDFLDLGYAYLLTSKGKIISHPEAKYVDKNIKDLLGFQPKLSRALSEVDNGQNIVSFIPVDGIDSVNWYVGVVLSKEQAYSPLANARNNAIIFGLVSVVITIFLLHLLLSNLMKPINQLSAAIKDIAQGDGDLTQRLVVGGNDEIGQLSANFNHFIETIHHSIKQVNEASDALEIHIDKVRQSSKFGLEMSSKQLSTGEHISSAITQLNSSSLDISTNAANAASLSDKMQSQSAQGVDALSNNIESIEKLTITMKGSSTELESLRAETENIGNILDVIKGVSSQTNLLALNAAIEAARAGEAGRGFAVVADEVRQLAQRTQESTSQIESIIENLQQGTNAVVSTMEESQINTGISVDMANVADQQMQKIIESLNDVDHENSSVATATQEQVNMIQTIDADIIELMAMNEKGVDNLHQTEEACDSLQQEFGGLNNIVRQFKV